MSFKILSGSVTGLIDDANVGTIPDVGIRFDSMLGLSPLLPTPLRLPFPFPFPLPLPLFPLPFPLSEFKKLLSIIDIAVDFGTGMKFGVAFAVDQVTPLASPIDCGSEPSVTAAAMSAIVPARIGFAIDGHVVTGRF